MDDLALLAAGQNRAVLGRPTEVAPSSITVDLYTAKGSWTLGTSLLTARTLLGQTLLITGLSAATLGAGYTTNQSVIIGVTEKYDLDQVALTFKLAPFNDSFVDEAITVLGPGGPDGWFSGSSTLSNQVILSGYATVTWYYNNTVPITYGAPWTLDSGQYPMNILIENEWITLLAPPSAPVAASGADWKQTFGSITRGAKGTAAANHTLLSATGDKITLDVPSPYIGF
jgi:hypothetical protein